MNREKITVVLFLSISLTRVLASEMVVSPDRKYSVTDNTNDAKIIIENLTTGVKDSVLVGSPLLLVEWLSDSNGVILVEHLAGGSQFVVIVRRHEEWRRLEIDPPEGDWDAYDVVGITSLRQSILVAYKAVKDISNEKPKFAFIQLEVSVHDVSISSFIIRELNEDAYRRMSLWSAPKRLNSK